jgi:hypothetical protein
MIGQFGIDTSRPQMEYYRSLSELHLLLPVPARHTAHSSMKSRIMYIERKAGALTGSARVGRVTFNRTGRTIYYRDQVFRRIVGGGFKSNYFEEATGEEYWISGPKRDGSDRLYGERVPIEIDEDVREEYWTIIRNLPDERLTQCA